MAIDPNSASKAGPDLSKLAGMSSRTVAVYKVYGNKKHLIVPFWRGASVEQIEGLHTSLPLMAGAGPGTYEFKVHDEGGNEKEEWVVRLGSGPEIDMSQMPGASSMPGGGTNGASSQFVNPGGGGDMPSIDGFGAGPGGTPIGSSSVQIAPGWFYVPPTTMGGMGLLITPDKKAFPWRQDQANPAAAGGAPWSTSAQQKPWWQDMPPWMMPPGANTGWGQMPTGGDGGGESIRLKALEEQLRAERETRREEQRQREAAETRAAFERSVAETNKRFEQIVEKMSAKPTGPSPTEEALKRELDLVKQQSMATDATRREEALRNEMREQSRRTEELVREATTKKEDPMIPLLGSIITTQQQTAAQMVQAVRDTATTGAQASERGTNLVAERLAGSVLTPERMMDMLRIAKDQTPMTEMNKGVMDMYKNLFGMSQDVLKMQAEMYQQGSGPAWAPIAQQAVDQIGRVAGMYAQQKARADAEGAAARQAEGQRRAAIEERRRTEARQRQPRQQQQQLAAQVAQQPQTPEQIRAEAAGKVWPHIAKPNGAPAQQPQPGVDPAVRRRGRPRKQATGEGNLAEVPTPEVKVLTDQIPDEEFFGAFHSQVLTLRQEVAKGMPPEQAANAVLMSRQYFAAYGELPPAIEVLEAGKIEILIERLLPEAKADYRVRVADIIRVQLRSEASGEGEDVDSDAA